MSDCAICPRPASDSRLCRSCIDELAAELRAMPWLVEQLTITLTRQSRGGSRNGGRSAETPLPFHPGASVDLESLRDGLATWCATVAQRRGISVDAEHEPGPLAAWLLRWLGEALQHPDAEELHGDIMAMTAAAKRTIDRAADLRYVGPCDGERGRLIPPNLHGCGADLYATMHAREVVCRTETCGAVYPIQERRVWLFEQAVDQLRTARQLAYELPWIAGVVITAKVIGMWAVRGKLTQFLPHPHDEAKAQRYRVGEVIELARSMASDQAARHVNGAA